MGTAALVAAFGLAGVSSAAQASSATAPAWTRQTPASSPPGRFQTAMAYDTANGTVVMFGGYGTSGELDDTWTWG